MVRHSPRSVNTGKRGLTRNSESDTLQVQWGQQDHYEIVRKVGRGKYSEVCSELSGRLGAIPNSIPLF